MGIPHQAMSLTDLAAHAHLVRVAVEPVRHRLKNSLVLP
jgi:hypothetical protein